jgi:hypothetical protein
MHLYLLVRNIKLINILKVSEYAILKYKPIKDEKLVNPGDPTDIMKYAHCQQTCRFSKRLFCYLDWMHISWRSPTPMKCTHCPQNCSFPKTNCGILNQSWRSRRPNEIRPKSGMAGISVELLSVLGPERHDNDVV